MKLHDIRRRLLLAGAALFLVVGAAFALWGSFSQLPHAHTTGQRLETVVQVAFGVLSLLTLLTCFRWRRWASRVRAAWTVSLALTTGLSMVVWGPPMLLPTVALTAAALLLSWAVTGALRAGTAERGDQGGNNSPIRMGSSGSRLILAVLPALLIASGGCDRRPDRPEQDGDGGQRQPQPAPSVEAEAAPVEPGPAPWSGAELAHDDVPAVYAEQWGRAANHATCGLFAFTELGEGASARPRAAPFAGGWAIAYDLPGQRSAFGIAGTGSDAAEPAYSEWPFRREWADGSSAGYGPEGGTGPNQLAYLRIAGERCLYNVWSGLGREHLELLLESLRRVAH